ncbi:MAG: DegV family EDD domain-containing protein [Lachnospiraceae bacterium]|nr:DegV family EDD domain-containing protein [Lachnospiraceae bacterium]
MRFWKDWLEKLNDPTRDPYERRFRLFAPVGMVSVLVWLVVISIIDFDLFRLLFFAGMLFAYGLTVMISLRTGYIQAGAVLCALGMAMVLMPFCFFREGGVQGGAFNYAVSSLIFILTSAKGRLRNLLIVIDLVTVNVCFVLAYLYPELLFEPDRIVIYVNAYTEMVITFILALAAILFQLHMFYQERAILERQRNEIEELNTAQNRFFSSMSHEIRTPINTIIGMNEIVMRDRSLSDETHSRLSSIHSASQMLLSLINDILDMSKMESGKMDIIPVEYETAGMLTEVSGMIAGRAAEKKLQFHVDVDDSLPARLFGDEVRIKQVLVNLLNNAVKYTAQGTVTMSVQGDREDDKHIRLTFRVEDTGMGIKKEAIPYLFEAFKRVDEEKNRNIEGTGLGLSIVKQIVDLMQGEIGVSSVYTKGSTFTVSLVQEIVDASRIGALQLTDDRKTDARSYYRQSFEAPDAHLLIVDDNEMNLAVETGLLKDTRMRIDTASSGKEALEKTLRTAYDVIFMDHLMPGMDGIECLKRIRTQEGGMNKETQVFALTANAGADNQALYASNGFDGYLLKPVSGQQLEAALLKALPENKVNLTGAETIQAQAETVFGQLGRKRRIRITMDSGGDLPQAYTERLDIGIVNYSVITDTGTFRDNAEIDSDELMRYMRDPSRTARSEPPSPQHFERFFGAQLAKAQQVIHITLSPGISSSYRHAVEAARSFDNVTVVDSLALSSGTGLLALYAARLAETELSVAEIVRRLDAVKKQIRTSFVMDNGDFFMRGGRISPVVNALLDAFLQHPVIEIKDGGTRAHTAGFSGYRKDYIKRTLRRFRHPDTSLLFITYVGMTEKELTEVKETVEEIVHFDRVVLVKASSAIAVNCGPGTFGLLFRTRGDDKETSKRLYDFLPEIIEEKEAVKEADEEETPAETATDTAKPVADAGAAHPAKDGAADVPAQSALPAALDTAEALKACGSQAVFDSALRLFYESAAQKADEIERYLENEDWENYTIKVHALKSSARLIGASALSEDAAHLEAMGNLAKG